MFTRVFDNKKYKVVSTDSFGLILQVPRYKKTDVFLGTKKDAIQKGYKPKGKENFYRINEMQVIDGYLAEYSVENKVEIKAKTNAIISEANYEELIQEINFLLNYNEKDK